MNELVERRTSERFKFSLDSTLLCNYYIASPLASKIVGSHIFQPGQAALIKTQKLIHKLLILIPGRIINTADPAI